MKEGLYKKISDTELLYAAEAIFYPNGVIINVSDYKNTANTYDGWKWFATEDDAYTFYGVHKDNEFGILPVK